MKVMIPQESLKTKRKKSGELKKVWIPPKSLDNRIKSG